MNWDKIRRELRTFVSDREWDKFHNPKNLVMALSGEAAELLEIFQWLTPEESEQVMTDPSKAQKVRDELADVLTYCVRLADLLAIDPDEAINAKMQQNAAKYPVELAKGRATKYHELK